MEIVKTESPKRVKLIDLADNWQAVVISLDADYLQMTIYGTDSNSAEVQLVAPFLFDSGASRSEVFENIDKLKDFASSVIISQMASIDPHFDTENFKPENPQ